MTSDCGVCIGGDYDGEQPDFYEALIVKKSRVEHICFECGRTIPAGAGYERVTGKWDGDFDSYVFCLECSDIATSLSCDGSRTFGGMWEDIEENLFPAMTTGCLNKLTTAAAKELLRDRWRIWKGLQS